VKVNNAGLELIKKYEGLRLKVYTCPAGILTVGYGHTGPDVRSGQTITPEKAAELLAADVEKFERGVAGLLRRAVTENQFSALVSFAYNLGLGNLGKSTLLKKLNDGDFTGAAAEFGKWNKAAGRVLPGLTARREAERTLFMK
jgi:lysozyme